MKRLAAVPETIWYRCEALTYRRIASYKPARRTAAAGLLRGLANLLAAHGLLDGDVHDALGEGPGLLVQLVHALKDEVAVVAG
jgi:hypothetical protein